MRRPAHYIGMALGHASLASEDAADAPPMARTLDFDAIYAAHFGFVWRSLRGLGVTPGLLDDASHDVFIVVHRRLTDIQSQESVRRWLYAIVRHVAANYRRSQRRRTTLPLFESTLPSRTPSPHERLADREAAEFMNAFVATLGTKKREVFVLGVIEGLTIAEVAAILHLPFGTAYTRLRSVRAELGRALRRKRSQP